MKIIAESVEAKDLKPGDLFSFLDVTYWQCSFISLGEKCYIRTEEPMLSDDDAHRVVTRITIEK